MTSTATAALDLAVANAGSTTTCRCLLGNGDGTFQPQVTYAVGSVARRDRGGRLHRRRPHSTWPSQTSGDDTVSVLLGNGDGTFQPQVTYAVGSIPDAIVAGDFTGDGHTRPGRRKRRLATAPCRCCWATATARSSPRSPTRWGRSRRDRGGRLHRRRPHSTWPSPTRRSERHVSVLLGNGDGTFQPQVTYAVGTAPTRSWRATSPATAAPTWPSPTTATTTCRCCWATATAPSSPRSPTRWGRPGRASWRATSPATAAPTWPSPTSAPTTVSVLLGNGDGTFTAAGQFVTTPHATPLVADVNGDGTDDVLVVDGAGDILYRQGIPGQPGTFEPPVTVNPGNPSRDIAWVTNPGQVPVLASVDAHDNAVSLYAYRDGGFVMVGSLATGPLPAQIIAADLNGNGLTDLVVRNAGDGTLSVFFGTAFDRARSSRSAAVIPPHSCQP